MGFLLLMIHRTSFTSLTLVSLAASMLFPMSGLRAQGVEGYYRYPTIHGDRIVFAAEGDLWTVPTAGGLARRLTTHLGEETHPRISPEGKTLAFTATYEGPKELYTMPLDGGLPQRWTYESDSSTCKDPAGRASLHNAAFLHPARSSGGDDRSEIESGSTPPTEPRRRGYL